MLRRSFTVLAPILALLVTPCAAWTDTTGAARNAAVAPAAQEPEVTQAEYRKVKKGMTRAQVRKVVGAKGKYRGNSGCGVGTWKMFLPSTNPVNRYYMVLEFDVYEDRGDPTEEPGPLAVRSKEKRSVVNANGCN